MTSTAFAELEFDRARVALSALRVAREITGADVAHLRGLFEEGSISRDEADMLFAAERAPGAKCAEWTEFFVEAVTDHVVWQMRPTGVVNESQGEWLIARVDEARTLNAFAALVNVLAEAHRVPLWFVSAARSRAARGWPGTETAMAAAQAEYALAA